MTEAERHREADRILQHLNTAKRRCTYGALAGLLEVHAREVSQYLGDKRPEASWVVRKDTGRPTGYAPDQLAEGLCDGPAPITDPEELRRLVDGLQPRPHRQWGRGVVAGIWAALGAARTMVMVTAITVSLLFNGLLVFSDTVSGAVGAVATAVGLSSVAARQAHALTSERAARTAAERTVQRQKNEIARAKNEAGTITRRVRDRWRSAAPREIAFMPAEALPVVGTTVIVAATAWELYDMCETMKDMAELERVFDPTVPDSENVATICSAQVPSRQDLVAMLADSPGTALKEAREYFNDLKAPELPSWDDMEETVDGWGDSFMNFLKDNWENARKWYDGDGS